MPGVFTPPSCIQIPNIENVQYEIRHATLQMLPTFYGLDRENPYDHLTEFLGICSTIRIQGLTADAIKLLMFPYSLRDKAKAWINTLRTTEPVTTWSDLQTLFLARFYSIGRTTQMRYAITHFV